MLKDTEFYAIVFIVLTIVVVGIIGALEYAQANGLDLGLSFAADAFSLTAILVIAILFSLVFLGIAYERN